MRDPRNQSDPLEPTDRLTQRPPADAELTGKRSLAYSLARLQRAEHDGLFEPLEGELREIFHNERR